VGRWKGGSCGGGDDGGIKAQRDKHIRCLEFQVVVLRVKSGLFISSSTLSLNHQERRAAFNGKTSKSEKTLYIITIRDIYRLSFHP
jgi:hypothetical protein